jgi:hypothetical protein
MKIQFSNSDLQRDSLGDAIDINPDDIVAEYDPNSEQPHILVIGNESYFYLEEYNRDHDRDLAMGLLLQTMQNDDGVQILAKDDSDEFLAHIEIIERDTDGSIYAQVTDQDEDCFYIPITKLQADGYDMPIASPATVTAQAKHVRLGDYVETTVHGHKGRVSGIHMVFADTGYANYWFRLQKPAYDSKQKLERWISILCDVHGSVLVAESRVKIIDKFDFTNPYAAEYFRD